MHAGFLGREDFLQILIAGLCRRQGMVAVAYGEKQRGLPGEIIPGIKGLRVCQLIQSGQNAPRLGIIAEDSLQRPAVLHKVELIHLFQFARAVFHWLDHRLHRIVDQQHNVRALQRSVLAHLDARRDALQHRPLRCADQGLGPLCEIILFQVDHTDQPAADFPIAERPAHIDKILYRAKDPVCQIPVHRCIHRRNPLLNPWLLQVKLRYDHAQGGGGVPHKRFHLLPIIRL